MRQKEEHKFLAALQGVDLSDKTPSNITDMTPTEVASDGFGIGLGLGHKIQSVEEVVA